LLNELNYRLKNPLLTTATIIPGSLKQFEVIRKNVCLRNKTIILQISNRGTDQLIKKDAHPQGWRRAPGSVRLNLFCVTLMGRCNANF